MNHNKVRVRFAPSPTGSFHIGSARTALFNYLFAKKNKGSFVMRIEDTDKERSLEKYEIDIMRSLRWLNINWDEGATENRGESGDFGPYRQSKRGAVYKKYLQLLLQEGKAYRCFCKKEALEKERKDQLKRGEAPKYSGKCADLSQKEGDDFVIRFRCPKEGKTSFNDLIREDVSFDNEGIGDFVIGKSDFSPLYNFAVVVDDQEMQITHVIRGEDHISNTPKQILLQNALGFDSPLYAHLPLILGSDRSKLSKRHATVSMYEYKEKGYLPEAMVNFISFLGWNPGGEEEIYSLDQIVEKFDISRCKKSGAIFNIEKLDSINGNYIRKKSDKDLAKLCLPFLISSGLLDPKQAENEEKIKEIIKIVSIYKERMKRLCEISEFADYFFRPDSGIDYDKDLLRWKDMSDNEIHSSIEKGIKTIEQVKEWNQESVKKALTEAAGEKKGEFLWPFRVALSGKKASAGPFEIAWILGPKKTINRLKNAKNKLSL